MKVILKSDSAVSVNGIDIVLSKGTGVEIPCQSSQEALEMCTIANLDVDLSYTENGEQYVAGAAGKFMVAPKAPKEVAAPKKAKEVKKEAAPKKAAKK